jgi:YVTN family beta-propeller protein
MARSRFRHPCSARHLGIAAVAVLMALLLAPGAAPAAQFPGPTNSSPIVLSRDQKLLWVVNPGGDNVAVINTGNSRVVARIKVGDEPEGVAVDPNNRYAYVANTADGSVTVIRISNDNPNRFKAAVAKNIGNNGKFLTGAEPWNIVASKDGRRVYVANSSQDTITVIDATRQSKRGKPTSPRVIGYVELRGSKCSPDEDRHFQPRGLAVSNNNKRLFVTSFFSFQRQGIPQVNDTGREGVVCRLNVSSKSSKISSYKPAQRIRIAAQDTGFAVDKTGDGIPDPTSAWPNQLQSIVIRGNQAYLPNIAASPEGPLRFNVSTQAFVNVLNNVNGSTSDGSQGRFLNLHLGARTPEAGKKKLFFANVWAVGFTKRSGSGAAYVVSGGSDLLVKVNVAGNGALSFTGGEQTTRYIDLNDPANPATAGDNAGKNPQGIVVNKQGSKAWVWNFVSRNVTAVNLNTDQVIRTIRIADLPRPGSQEETVAVGAEVFFGSRGNFSGPGNPTSERLSSEGWQSCASCHFKGLTDSVVWAFNAGPRKSIPLNASFNPRNRDQQKILNYSAVNDEVEDFDLNTRNVSGPGALGAAQTCANPLANQAATSTFDPNHGLIISDVGNVAEGPCTINAIPALANANRQQVTVTLPGSNVAVPASTAMREWVRFAVRTPDAPFTQKGLKGTRLDPGDVRDGERLFEQQGCNGCHGTNLFSVSIKDYTSPPAAAQIGNERTGTFVLNPVGAPFVFRGATGVDFLRNINSFNLGVPNGGNPIGDNIGGAEKTTQGFANGVATPPFDALGRDYNGDGVGNGYTVPSLLGIDASPPFYHNGACETLACVLTNVNHRTGLGAQPDRLGNARDREKVVQFLRSID